MKINSSKFKSILPKTISAVLVFWLSSVLVLVCCSPHLFMASASTVKVEDSTCPMPKGHECCKKNQANNISGTEKVKDSCCIYKPQRTLSGDLQTIKITKQIQAVAEKIETPKPVYFIQSSYQAPKVYHSAIRNRGSTYLQNCVFRI